MAAISAPVPPASTNRRGRLRHKIRTPAYATFPAEAKGAVLDLHAIADLSEEGLALECHTPLDVGRHINLCLDLAGIAEHIYATGEVIWTSASGRAGMRFSDLSPASLFRLREWLFLNAMTGLTLADEAGLAAISAAVQTPPPLSYSDTLATVTAVQREVEALGSDLAAALELIVIRAHKLLRASGAALALSDDEPGFMICRAAAGPDAPPVGARLQVGSGFSGECVKSGQLQRCDDAENDPRIDSEVCRALRIRSILAVPLRAGDKSIGILEVFSPQLGHFKDSDASVLQRLAETVLAAVNRTARARNLPVPGEPAPVSFEPAPGSVLFASEPKKESEKENVVVEKPSSGISLPRSHLIILICVAAVISTVLGDYLAPWIQSKLRERGQVHLQTVLASASAPKSAGINAADPPVETASVRELRQMAENGNAAAEAALGRRYYEGDQKNGIDQDEKEAFRWFSKAAEDGSLSAQATVGLWYWSGRGVEKDLNKAYFWTVLARARGDRTSKDLAIVLASSMKRSRCAAIEQEADIWLQQHPALMKPAAGR